MVRRGDTGRENPRAWIHNCKDPFEPELEANMISRGVTILFLAVSLISCSGIRVAQDFDPAQNFSALHTFAWSTAEPAPSGDPRVDNPLLHNRIRQAISAHLDAKGIQRVAAAPRFAVRYQYLLRRSITDYGPSVGFGIGTGRHGGYGGLGIGSGGMLQDHDEGALIIDFSDPQSGDLIWRGSGTHIYREHTDPQRTIQEINRLVEKILSQFPPKY